MTSIDSFPIQDAELEANSVSVTKWFWIGLLLGLIGVLIVYLRSPKASAALLANYEEGERWMFERNYTESLKNREVKETWIGFVCVAGLHFVILSRFLWGWVSTVFSTYTLKRILDLVRIRSSLHRGFERRDGFVEARAGIQGSLMNAGFDYPAGVQSDTLRPWKCLYWSNTNALDPSD